MSFRLYKWWVYYQNFDYSYGMSSFKAKNGKSLIIDSIIESVMVYRVLVY